MNCANTLISLINVKVGINVDGGLFGKNQYKTLINEELRVEKSKKLINVEGEFLFCGGWNFSKSVSVGSTFIRQMRVFAPPTFRKPLMPLNVQVLYKALMLEKPLLNLPSYGILDHDAFEWQPDFSFPDLHGCFKPLKSHIFP